MHFSLPRRIALALPALLAAALLAGCGTSDPKSPKFVVAKGKGVKVTRADLDKAEAQFFQQRGISKSQVPLDQLMQLDREATRQLALQSLLFRESGKAKVPGLDEKVKAEIDNLVKQVGGDKAFDERLKTMNSTRAKLKEDVERQVRLREYLRASVPPSADPPAPAVEKFYADNKGRPPFTRPATVRASHVLLAVPPNSAPAVKAQKKAAADAARARVAAPKGAQDFAKVAAEVSQDPGTARRGGDLGYFAQGRMVPAFDKVAFETPVGAVSPVFETPFGYHFLKVTERRPAGTATLEEARPQVIAILKQARDAENLKAFFAKLESDAKIVYTLPPPSLGAP
jgi:parvulin-like peptidyl-prolyl isomerase